MLLIMTLALALSAPQAHAFYLDRWGIEHLPLAANPPAAGGPTDARRTAPIRLCPQARQRLPELALLAGSVLSYVAACEIAIPTGFWEGGPPRGHRAPNPRRTGAYPRPVVCAVY